MLLGALVDAGMPLGKLKKELKKLRLTGYTLSHSEVKRKGLHAAKVDVKLTGKAQPPARKLRDVRAIIKNSTLSPEIKKKGLTIFGRLFEAEAHVHGTTTGRVHLHELGAVDAIVDIMGVLICLDHLGIHSIKCSPVNLGSGTINTAHGIMSVPAPATAALLVNIPVYSEGSGELTTPTGAAIISTLCHEFGQMPSMKISSIGTGAGSRQERDMPPNTLSLYLGSRYQQAGNSSTSPNHRTVTVMETNIDDMNPEIYAHIIELLFEAGALDVWLTPIVMKKSRPAATLSAICYQEHVHALGRIILSQSTALGLRIRHEERMTLKRNVRKVKTPYGSLRVKDAFIDGKLIRSVPEYEDSHKAALKHDVPIMDVMQACERAAKLSGK